MRLSCGKLCGCGTLAVFVVLFITDSGGNGFYFQSGGFTNVESLESDNDTSIRRSGSELQRALAKSRVGFCSSVSPYMGGRVHT